MRVKTLKRIRYNGNIFEKGDELDFLEEEEAREYISSGMFIKLESEKAVEEKNEEIIEESENGTIEEILEDNPVVSKITKRGRGK
ncbi:hypothetical protein VSU16_05155 [Cetobacterium somerae]|uniref:hypothetical protein n=1 Tax=Cetobacterium somerae TaxID=188913 RepID=UPI002E7AFB4A|nr:hypothetical protein [Cetobacterium somerae]WVJ02133.1 hypothetical protein VSU16_05155 [Cetobacterium somerae]